MESEWHEFPTTAIGNWKTIEEGVQNLKGIKSLQFYSQLNIISKL